jgi:hypothetical protein
MKKPFLRHNYDAQGHTVALWLKHYATNWKVAGLIPDEMIPATLGPGVYSASNRNEYQKHKNNTVSGE